MSRDANWVVGVHAINAILDTQPERGLRLLLVTNLKQANQAELLAKARALGLSVEFTDKRGLGRQVGVDNHQGVALQARAKPELNEHSLKQSLRSLLESDRTPLILILDQVQDPHNLGACLRTAAAAGVDAVVLAKDNSCPITPVVQKVASGAVEMLSIARVTNLARCMQDLRDLGIWIVGTSDKASENLFKIDFNAPTAIAMGAEGKGLRKLTMQHCDHLVQLPMADAIVSSLNVSVATGVCLFEAVRQRQQTAS